MSAVTTDIAKVLYERWGGGGNWATATDEVRTAWMRNAEILEPAIAEAVRGIADILQSPDMVRILQHFGEQTRDAVREAE